MALIIYPTDDYTSYITLAECETLVIDNIIDTTTWDALSDPLKEKYLRQSTLLIKNKITVPKEETTPDNIKLATMYLSVHSIGKDMLNKDDSGNLKRKNIDKQTIAKEWFSPNKDSNEFPDIVALLLQDYGYSGGSSFRISRS